MAEFINYGDQQIDQQQLLTNLANNVTSYVEAQPWTKKRKQKFMQYYTDIVNRGILGASNNTGQWMLDVGGAPYPEENLSKKDQQMLGEAAYFIQQQMASLPTKSQTDESSDLPIFDNTYFTKDFNSYINDQISGGHPLQIGGEDDQWNYLDKRNEKGIRGRTERAKKLAEILENYGKKLDVSKVTFEGGPFENEADFRTRLNNAITALRSQEIDDDSPALSALGISPNIWFNDGSGDFSGEYDSEGNPLTYAQLQDYNNSQQKAKQEEAKQQQDINKEKAIQQHILWQQNLFKGANKTKFGLTGTDPAALSKKYSNDAGLLKALQQYSTKDKLSNTEAQDMLGAFVFYNNQGRLTNITKQEMEAFKGLRDYVGVAPNRLKKLKGLEGVYFDTQTNQIVRPYRNQNNLQQEDLLSKQNPTIQPRGGGSELTKRDIVDIGATLADLGALINPEVISGTVMSLGASVARTANRDWTNGGVWDNIWKSAVDIGTGALGGTPLLGDASSLYKFARGFGQLMTLPAVIGAFNNRIEAKQAIDKLDFSSIGNLTASLKTLTPADFQAISSVLTGLVAGRNHLRSNLSERRVLEHSGYTADQINASKGKIRQFGEKYGVFRTKIRGNEVEVPTIKMKVDGNNVEIKLKDQAHKQQLEKKLNEAGNSAEARNKILQEEFKGKDLVGKDGKIIKTSDKTKFETTVAPKKYADKFSSVSSKLGTTKSYFGKTTAQAQKGEGDFDEWLKTRSNWNRWKFGSDKNLTRIRQNLGITKAVSSNEPTPKPTPQETPKETPNISHNESRKLLRKFNKRFDKSGNYRDSAEPQGAPKIKEGEIESFSFNNPNGKNVTFNIKSNNGKYDLMITEGDNAGVWKTVDVKELRKNIAETSRRMLNSAKGSKSNPKGAQLKEIGDFLRKLNSKNLKQGGSIDRQRINKYKNLMNNGNTMELFTRME